MTTNRREMLCRTAGALTGLTFTGCGLMSPALAQEPLRRREVVVNGSHVRTVDVHAHCHIPEANALKVQLRSLVISPERTKVMDDQGIDIEALSINPIFWYKAEPDLAGQVVKLQNEKLAEICAAQPERFVGLASVALQHPDLAASSSNMRSSSSACAVRWSAAASMARSSRIRNFIRSGPRPNSSAC
jgi:predicted TIM-barrel fold metal-dependent hydrolase